MPDRAPIHVYAGPYVDRASELRKDDAWLAGALANPATRYVLVWRQRNLVRTAPAPGAVLLEREMLVRFAAEPGAGAPFSYRGDVLVMPRMPPT